MGRASRVVPIMALAILLWGALATWAISSPVASSPDDDYHLAMIYCAADKADCVREGTRVWPCFKGAPGISGDCTPAELIPADGRRAAADLGSLTVPSTKGIIVDWYPPMFYEANAWLVGDTLADTSLAIRLSNVTLAVLFAVGSVLLTNPRLRQAVTLSWLVCSVPLGMFLMASTNPHAWTLIGLASLWGPLLSFVSKPSAVGLAVARLVFVQAATILALGSRSESPYYVGLIALTCAVFAVARPRAMSPRRWWALGVLALMLVESAVAASTYSASEAKLRQSDAVPGAEAATHDLIESVIEGSSVLVRTLSRPLLGWLDTDVPVFVGAVLLACYFALIVTGLFTVYPRKVIALLLAVGFTVSLPTYLWLASTAAAPGLQPRYFLPLLLIVVGLALVPRLDAGPIQPNWWQLALVLGALATVNSVALQANLNRYLRPPSPLVPSPLELQGLQPHWWFEAAPVGPFAAWAAGSFMFVAAMVLIWWLLSALSVAPQTRSAVARHAGWEPPAGEPQPSTAAPQEPFSDSGAHHAPSLTR